MKRACTTALWKRYRSGRIPVIPDIKCYSPRAGDLLRGRNPVQIAKNLASAGAPLISVVTEEKHFGGSADLLRQIAQAVAIPILRKDFITAREQLLESVAIGANGVLLIASMMDKEKLTKLVEEALALDMEPLVEVHNRREIIAANKLGLTFLGINNRNIIEFELDDGDVGTTEKLAGLARPGVFILSESSINSVKDVRRAAASGAHGALVGSAILQAPDEIKIYHQLAGSGRWDHDTG